MFGSDNLRHVGREIKKLNNLVARSITNLPTIKELDELTGNNGAILSFLAYNEENNVTQKDVETAFGITRSTTSTVLSLMEKKELIERVVNSEDARCKTIIVTKKGKEYVSKIKEEISFFEAMILKGFTEKEIDMFFKFINRIECNLKEGK